MMDRLSTIRARKVVCDTGKVRSAAEKKGYQTPEALALAVGCDVKTIRAMLNGEGNFKSIIRNVAHMLGMNPDGLLPDGTKLDSIEPGSSESETNKLVKFIFRVPERAIANKTTLEFIIDLSKEAGTKDDMVIDDEGRGSRLIYVELTTEDATRVFNAFIEGHLNQFGIESITAAHSPSVQKPSFSLRSAEPIPQIVSGIPDAATDIATLCAIASRIAASVAIRIAPTIAARHVADPADIPDIAARIAPDIAAHLAPNIARRIDSYPEIAAFAKILAPKIAAQNATGVFANIASDIVSIADIAARIAPDIADLAAHIAVRMAPSMATPEVLRDLAPALVPLVANFANDTAKTIADEIAGDFAIELAAKIAQSSKDKTTEEESTAKTPIDIASETR
jgi:hypothetical protein